MNQDFLIQNAEWEPQLRKTKLQLVIERAGIILVIGDEKLVCWIAKSTCRKPVVDDI